MSHKDYSLRHGTVICFGDSLTQYGYHTNGWVTLLSNYFIRRADVLNRGYSGYNTRWALSFFNHLTTVNKVDLMVVCFGANDAVDPLINPAVHVPLNEYESNLKKIIIESRTVFGPNLKIILCAPPPCNPIAWLKYTHKEKYNTNLIADINNDSVEKYALCCNKLVNDIIKDNVNNDFKDIDCSNLQFINTWTGIMAQDNWQSFLSDGLHFSEKGNQWFFDKIAEVINEKFSTLAVIPSNGNYGAVDSNSELLPHLPWWTCLQEGFENCLTEDLHNT